MALKFDIKSTQDCGTLKYTNCSTYCDADNYTYQMLIAGVKPITNKNLFGDTLQLEADYYTTQGVTDPSTQVKWNLNSVDYFGTTVILPVTTGVNTITLEVTDVVVVAVDTTVALIVDVDTSVSRAVSYLEIVLNVVW